MGFAVIGSLFKRVLCLRHISFQYIVWKTLCVCECISDEGEVMTSMMHDSVFHIREE